MLVITLASLMMFYFSYLQLYPFTIVELLEDPIRIDKKEYRKGDEILLTMKFKKNYEVKAKITYYLVNHVVRELPTVGGVARPTGTQTRELYVALPDDIKPETYYIQIDLEYPITPLRTILYSWKTDKFKIIN